MLATLHILKMCPAFLFIIPGIAVIAAGFFLYIATIEMHLTDLIIKIALPIYIFAVLFSFWRALETWGTAGKAFTVLISAGTLIFFIGDYFIARDVYLKEEYHQAVNNILYYTPQILLALSMVYYKPLKKK